MKDFIFISDFDGTITKKDFYWILLDDYIGEKGVEFYRKWKKCKKIGTEFLNTVFTWHEFTDEERLEALDKVELDENLENVVEFVREKGGDFHILSAGFKYYIDDALGRRDLSHLSVITNGGDFRNGTFVMEPDEQSPFYSDVYGVDKEKVATYYKEQCKKLYFVGDSEPDFWAAKHADVVFAKNELADIMDKEGMSYYKYEDFRDVLEVMKKTFEPKKL